MITKNVEIFNHFKEIRKRDVIPHKITYFRDNLYASKKKWISMGGLIQGALSIIVLKSISMSMQTDKPLTNEGSSNNSNTVSNSKNYKKLLAQLSNISMLA